MSTSLQVGDWCYAFHPGIWQIFRIIRDLEGFLFPQMTWGRSTRTTLFVKRFVNTGLNRSFRSECCDESLIRPVSSTGMRQLEGLIARHPRLHAAFLTYRPPCVDSILNLSSSLDAAISAKVASENLAGLSSCDQEQVYRALIAAGVADTLNQNPRRSTFQFVSREHLVIDNRLRYAFSRVIPS
jgi:hypothetical protein